ncbi:MAG TPA: HEPN/Toprim-associated domain-containing protein [Anaerolineales bacterium]|jgi:hypothetical protein|nr:HEPN/Toprim-associated domain-containing protein [Anaerolineales bacterium]HQX16472.1 HEPN/Toprim-associated domain-containing protein [Anaerolineales bacterium]
MGSYAECWLSSFYVGSTRDEFDPSIMQLFRSFDKNIFSGVKREIPTQSRRWLENLEDDESVDVVYYSAPVNFVRDRLNLKGYTLDTCRTLFADWVNREIKQLEEWSHRQHGEVFTEKIRYLQIMDVDSWLSSLKTIYTQNLKPRSYRHNKDEHDETLIGYMLQNQRGDWYGFPGLDLNIALRLVLEVLPEVDEFIYDLTDLILGGGYSQDDDFVKIAFDWSSGSYMTAGKTIILTEGSIDTWIISESLDLLYPHLSDYFTFMDFEGARVGGGAGSLANMVKAFSGTGIVNKVVAFFDNDTAAATALRGLKLIQIPSNIKIVQLPKIDFLTTYPTIGPSGQVEMDVNSLAGSIELYLGKDVLLDSNGNLIPVQWTGYVSDIGNYQGEVLFKEEIQKKFKQKVSACKADKKFIEKTDWSGMQAILRSLFSAFHEFDKTEIRALVKMSE